MTSCRLSRDTRAADVLSERAPPSMPIFRFSRAFHFMLKIAECRFVPRSPEMEELSGLHPALRPSSLPAPFASANSIRRRILFPSADFFFFCSRFVAPAAVVPLSDLLPFANCSLPAPYPEWPLNSTVTFPPSLSERAPCPAPAFFPSN